MQRLAATVNPFTFCLGDSPVNKQSCVSEILSGGSALNSNLQALAVRLTFHKAITLCCIYIPPNVYVTLQDFGQLPSPYILISDLNGHNPIWVGNNSNARAQEDFIAKNALCL